MNRMEEMNNPEFIPLSVAVGVATLCFLLYWFVAYSESYRRFLSVYTPAERVDVFLPFYQKGLGILLIGIIPMAVLWTYSADFFKDYGIMPPENLKATFLWIISFGVLLAVIPFFSSRKQEMQAMYPQVRIHRWSAKLFTVNALVWAVYLYAYEFLFRSFLLCSLLMSLETAPAIVITTAISVATHMPKGAVETFGTIPFSIMLCMAMVSTGSIWAGFIIHLALALSNDFWALFFNPEMELKKRVVPIN